MSTTLKQVIDAAIVAAEQRPEYVYHGIVHTVPGTDIETTRCMYVEGEQPGCIFGHAFVRAGIPLADVSRIERYQWDTGACDTSIDIMLDALMVEGLVDPVIDDVASALVAGVQQAQDNGQPWGSVEVLDALRHLSEHLA